MNILKNTSIMLVLALVVGMLLDLSILRALLPYILAVLMFISLSNLTLEREIFKKSKKALWLFLTNYIFHTGLLLALSFLLIEDPHILNGLIIIAIVPPAIATVPFTLLYGGDNKATVLSEFLSYALALAIIPLGFLYFFGTGVDLSELIFQISLMIIAPFIVSRFIQIPKPSIDKYFGAIANIAIFLVFATAISINKAAIVALNPVDPIFTLMIIRNLLFPGLVLALSLMICLKKDFTISLMLFSVQKNMGLATVLALSLFHPAAAIPATLAIFFEVLFFILLPFAIKILKH